MKNACIKCLNKPTTYVNYRKPNCHRAQQCMLVLEICTIKVVWPAQRHCAAKKLIFSLHFCMASWIANSCKLKLAPIVADYVCMVQQTGTFLYYKFPMLVCIYKKYTIHKYTTRILRFFMNASSILIQVLNS